MTLSPEAPFLLGGEVLGKLSIGSHDAMPGQFVAVDREDGTDIPRTTATRDPCDLTVGPQISFGDGRDNAGNGLSRCGLLHGFTEIPVDWP